MSRIKLYRFRSASNLEFILDIILNKRLYCANWKDLNDPMEGHFRYIENSEPKRIIDNFLDKLKLNKEKYRICSLTKYYDQPLLWAHYASGHNGVAIEFEFPNDCGDLKKVIYLKKTINFKISASDDDSIIRKYARVILQTKLYNWEYENELRLLSEKEFFYFDEEDVKVTGVIMGCRSSSTIEKALKVICTSEKIGLSKLDIDLNRTIIYQP